MNDLEGFTLDAFVEQRYPATESWHETAKLCNMSVEDYMLAALYEKTDLRVIDVPAKKGEAPVRTAVPMLPGQIWLGESGPRPARVMMIGRRPSLQDMRVGSYFCGRTGSMLMNAFRYYGVDTSDFYVSSVVKFIPPDGAETLKARHIKDCAPLLVHELLMVKPDYILLFGANAVKALFGNKMKLSAIRGAVVPFNVYEDIGTYPDNTDLLSSMGTQVMATITPGQVDHDPSAEPEFKADIGEFAKLLTGQSDRTSVAVGQQQQHYHYIDNATELDALVDRLIAEDRKVFSFDIESGGGFTPREGWLRTVQISWEVGHSVVVVLRTAKSQRDPVFQPSVVHAIESLRRLLDRDGVRLIGQNARFDAMWLEDIGLPVMRRLWFDTMLASHALDESEAHGLTALTLKYTNMGRYDLKLEAWKQRNPHLVKENMAYAHIPDDILHPYAAGDTDATFRVAVHQLQELEKPENAKIKKLFYGVIMPSNQPIHEIERNGLYVDTDRMLTLLWRYEERKQELLKDLRRLVHWPTFNPRSQPQKVQLLYGKPEDGMLGLMPIKTTEKPSREWREIITLAPDEQARVNPSTDGETLDLLAIDVTADSNAFMSLNSADKFKGAAIQLLQDFQTVDQVTKNFLRKPDLDEEELGRYFTLDDYNKGLLGYVGPDGRIRTTISQIMETGRHSSRRPNLQNISKRREGRYKEIMGKDVPKLRSCLCAKPGHVLIEADFKSAEIVSLAYISGDRNLITDALGKVKLHAKVAVDILRAPCAYEVVSKQFEHLYIAAKNINFGIPYQRGAKAIARQINRETKGAVAMTVDQAQKMIDDWYARYAMVRVYVDRCKEAVNNPPHYIETPWGRRRHFYPSDSRSIMAGQEREAVNFPIQGTVADALNVALYNLWYYRQLHPEVEYDICLAIHDAVMLEAPVEMVGVILDEVLPACMVHGVTIPATATSQSFHLDIDPEVGFRWGETPTKKELAANNIPEQYWPKEAA